MLNIADLTARATATLAANDAGHWTRPSPGLYPHQWLWDSCFIAIGLARTNPDRAARELLSLARGQWRNGMMPHMIYSSEIPYRYEALLWGTVAWAPSKAKTSGFTQPPLLAYAAEVVAGALPPRESQVFVQAMLPVLVRYHEWIYRDRDPRGIGLAVALHSWESGLDDTPYWTEPMKALPPLSLRWRWLRAYRFLKADQRAKPSDLQHMVALAQIMRRNHYDSAAIIENSPVVIEDLVFNCVLAAANESLERLAESAGESLPGELRKHFGPTRFALQEFLWDGRLGQYFSRDYHTGALIREPTIATFLPLFSGTASPAQADQLRRHLVDAREGFNTAFPLPSVPTSSPHFEPQRYWRGPVWINMNWFIILGLERYGFYEEAGWLKAHTLGLVDKIGFREYYHPLTGAGLGGRDFAWSAALTLDLLARPGASDPE